MAGTTSRKGVTGFTIVELLIVIVVIGILAAITIVAFNGVQNQARVSAIRSDLTNAAKTLETYRFTVNAGVEKYPATQADANFKISPNTTLLYVYNSVANAYCMTASTGTAIYMLTSYDKSPKAGDCSISNGLLGSWPLNGNANDVSGNGRNGTATAVTATNGQNGQTSGAYVFNGSQSVIEMASVPWQTNSFTASAWFSTSASVDMKIVSATGLNPIQAFSSGRVRTCVSTCTEGGPIINDTQWHMVVTVGDGASVRTYLDGNTTPIITQAALVQSSTGVFRIGKDVSVNTMTFNGTIDDVRMYNRVLSLDDIQTLYAAGAR